MHGKVLCSAGLPLGSVLSVPLLKALVCVAGVLASQPDLFFLSSGLGMTGFQDQLPSPNLPVTIFAPTNSAILNLLSQLSEHCAACFEVGPYCLSSLVACPQ